MQLYSNGFDTVWLKRKQQTQCTPALALPFQNLRHDENPNVTIFSTSFYLS